MSNKKVRHQKKPLATESRDIRFRWIIGIVLSISFVATIKTLYQPQIQEITDTTNQVTNITKAQWQKILEAHAVISTPTTFQPLNKTFMLIPIKYDNNASHFTTLTLEGTSIKNPHVFIINHPLLNSLEWPFVEENNIVLYQKQKQYDSVAKFFESPPQNMNVLIDKHLQQLPQFANLTNAQALETSFDVNKVDFIVTTFKPLKKYHDGLVFERIIDASEGKLDADKALSWIIETPDANAENPYYIGHVHVDYRY